MTGNAIAALSMVVSLTFGTAMQQVEVEEIAVCIAPGDQAAPAVSGPFICYEDERERTRRVVVHYLKDGTDHLVTPGHAGERDPAVYERWLVWVDTQGLWAHDLFEDEDLCLSSAAGQKYRPAVSGETVVWMDTRFRQEGAGTDDLYDLIGYSFAESEEFVVCRAPGNQSAPSASGPVVVWEDWRNSSEEGPPNPDIMALDLRSGTKFPICTAPGPQVEPAISNNIVVWHELGGPPTGPGVMPRMGIYGYDMEHQQEFVVQSAAEVSNGAVTFSSGRITQHSVSISNGFVIWQENQADENALFGRSLSTGRKAKICDVHGDYVFPDVYHDPRNGETIVTWRDDRNGDWDVLAVKFTLP